MDFKQGLYIDNGYIDWQTKRIRYILKLYGADFFKNKKVLELGSYQGGVTKILHNLGANVTGVEGLEENITFCRSKYPNITFIKCDLDTDEFLEKCENHYDIVIHWGLLYHLKDQEQSIRNCSKITNTLFLETLVTNSTDKDCYTVAEKNVWGTDQSINNLGTRSSITYIEHLLSKYGFGFIRHDTTELDSQNQPLYSDHTKEISRGFWTCEKSIV